MDRWPVFVALLALSGCADMVKTASLYSNNGMYEFAVPYYVANYMSHPKDKGAKALLQGEVTLVFKTMDMSYQQLRGHRQYQRAAGVALRKEVMALSLQDLPISNVDVHGAERQFSDALRALAKEAVKEVDQAEIKQLSLKKRMRLLRKASGLNPDNPELDERYKRLRGLAMRYVRIRCVNTSGVSGICQVMTGKLESAICRVNREFVTVIIKDNDPRINTGIDIRILGVKTGDTNWMRIKHGRVKAGVKRLNRFLEPVIRDGNPVYDTVAASYAIFRRITSAQVGVRIRVRDMGRLKRVIYSKEGAEKKSSERTFYRWSGDERAIRAHPGIAMLGTSEYPPVPESKLVFLAGDAAMDGLLNGVINTMEYR